MKVLVLGDGLLGKEIVKQTGWDIVSRKLGNLPDINNFGELANLVYTYDVVVNCIAHTDTYSKDKQPHYDINYKFAADLSDVCNNEDVKLVHISTEFVYANNKGLPTEEDIPIPGNTWYGHTKMLADEYIQLCNSDYLICRELHKPNPFPYSEVWDIQTSGDTVNKIASLIIKLINKDAKGVFNVGTGSKNLKELAPFSKGIPAPTHVPKDTRMNLDKLNEFLGCK